ncbi:Hypothetical predicted protein [Prunus dulcis]|uniref:Uncharacterized protein n=1 Tax=Prunus dulcis TaxID=3755 RepID=A0A5E4G2V6_PRUDU|nr:Hypothetical predicted protein [Prunus dulcis]
MAFSADHREAILEMKYEMKRLVEKSLKLHLALRHQNGSDEKNGPNNDNGTNGDATRGDIRNEAGRVFVELVTTGGGVMENKVDDVSFVVSGGANTNSRLFARIVL